MTKRPIEPPACETGSVESKRVRHNEESTLCKLCDQVDSDAYFNSPQKAKVKLGSLRERSLACLLCRRLVAAAQRHQNLASSTAKAGLDDVAVTASQLKPDPSHHLWPNAVNPIYRLAFYIKRTRIDVLEPCVGIARSRIKPTHMFRMLWKPLQPSVPVGMFRSWLESTNVSGDEKRSCSTPRGLDSESLHQYWHLVRENLLRVLDVETFEVKPLKKERYVALSYVWGGIDLESAVNRSVIECTPNDRDHVGKQGAHRLDPHKLPRTITDAARVVKALVERYLWVDSLCIDQHNHAEKLELIAHMRAIYRSAWLTLVAADGANADSGISRVRAMSQAREPILSIKQKGLEINCLSSLPSVSELLASSPWGRRGWTYQEQVLSWRCLYFTHDEALFTCGRLTYRETYIMEKVAEKSPEFCGNLASREVSKKHCKASPTTLQLLPPFTLN